MFLPMWLAKLEQRRSRWGERSDALESDHPQWVLGDLNMGENQDETAKVSYF